jgi:hypothetical protein
MVNKPPVKRIVIKFLERNRYVLSYRNHIFIGVCLDCWPAS